MKITLRGVRGSIPTFGPEYSAYGGNTSCIEIMAEGWWLVLDGGSGIRYCGSSGEALPKRVDILLTHLHLDHIQGLGFFNPLFTPGMEVHIWGPASSAQSLHSRLSRYLSPPLFPVHIRELPCKLLLHEIDNSAFEIGPFSILSRYIIHPGATVGFRVKQGNSTFSFLPDHEPALGLQGMGTDCKWISGIDLAMGADLLLHDAQYSIQEYQLRIGWGHSSMDHTAEFASLAGVKQLLLSHHDPNHSDVQINQLYEEMRNRVSFTYECKPAVEGMEFELS